MAIKRIIDVLVALTLLVITAPLMVLLAVGILLSSGLPIVFTQTRSGLGGRSFTFYKFRTMRAGAAGESDAARLTAVGRFLRAASLDELPQLWNVLRGDMSLVGPRPLLPQ